MTENQSEVTRKTVDDMLIASIRYRGQYEEAGAYFEKLYPAVKDYIVGTAFALYHDQDFE